MASGSGYVGEGAVLARAGATGGRWIGVEKQETQNKVKQIEEKYGKTFVSEGSEANYHDMVNYAVFALIHLQSEAA